MVAPVFSVVVRPGTVGQAVAQALALEACGSWSPHEPTQKRVGRGFQKVPVQCNRLAGHDGNHMWSSTTDARLAEWGPAEVVR